MQTGEPSSIPMMPAKTRTVHLPHDYMIESDVTPNAKNGVNGGCYEGAIMSYTKKLDSEFGRGIWNDYTEAFAVPWDIVGYNYLNYHYAEAAELFPNRVILATESKPREVEQYWSDVEKYPFLIGDFEWTSQDYLGEAGIGKVLHVEKEQVKQATQAMSYSQYPWRCAQAGDFDLCGFEKPQLHFKRIVWGSKETYIAVKDPRFYGKVELIGWYGWTDCAHSWSWPMEPGSPVEVEAVDGNGNHIPYVEAPVTASVEGAAVLAAFDTGRTSTEENYTSGKITLYHGTALAILRSGVEAGSVKLTVTGEGLGTAEAEIPVN